MSLLKIRLFLVTLLVVLSHLVTFAGCFLILTITQIIPRDISIAIANAMPISAPAGFVLTAGEATIIGLIYIFGGILMTCKFTEERRSIIKQIEDEENVAALEHIPMVA